MSELKTKIGLEIHVQLKTQSKMFCACDNNAEGKKPNTTVCPICLGMPGVLPTINEQAVLMTMKTGLVLNCKIAKIAKFDRKHYFYPDLPKGYQISQYDEPFCVGGYLEAEGHKIRLNRIHLEEDAGKLIHKDGKSLVDLNRAGTPLMEIVTEPDIDSPLLAGAFLRELQKIVRDVSAVSDANMEKGHLRCDANISVSDETGKMSEIVELKNINSFRFVEKALALEDIRLKEKYPDWPAKNGKETRGYDSKKNITYSQRVKEEASDYRYFPEPDLPPYDSSKIDLLKLKQELNQSGDQILIKIKSLGVGDAEAKYLSENKKLRIVFEEIGKYFGDYSLIAKALVNNYFGFEFSDENIKDAPEFAKALEYLGQNKISKAMFGKIVAEIENGKIDFASALEATGGEQIGDESDLKKTIAQVLSENSDLVGKYKSGQTQLMGFFVGLVMKKTSGKADPKTVNTVLKELLS